MLIDEIKKANIKAMKEHDQNARTAYSMVISSYQSLLTSGSDKEVGDADLIKIIVKFGKELDEEGNGYKQANREEDYKKYKSIYDEENEYLIIKTGKEVN